MSDERRWLALVTFERRDDEQEMVPDLHEVFSLSDVEEVDDHLAANLRDIEPGKQTVWGTIHGYKGEGEA